MPNRLAIFVRADVVVRDKEKLKRLFALLTEGQEEFPSEADAIAEILGYQSTMVRLPELEESGIELLDETCTVASGVDRAEPPLDDPWEPLQAADFSPD